MTQPTTTRAATTETPNTLEAEVSDQELAGIAGGGITVGTAGFNECFRLFNGGNVLDQASFNSGACFRYAF